MIKSSAQSKDDRRERGENACRQPVQVRFVQQRSSAANTTKTLQKKRPL